MTRYLWAAGLALWGCSTPSVTPAASPTPNPPTVVVDRAERSRVDQYREYTGTSEAIATVDVRARVEGTLLNFSFREGSEVRARQVLFRLDPREYQAAVDAAQANLDKALADLAYARSQVELQKTRAQMAEARYQLRKAQRDVNRYKPLAQNEVIAQQILDDAVSARDAAQSRLEAAQATVKNTALNNQTSVQAAQAVVNGARAQLENARLRLSYCVIESPIAGVIGEVNVTEGNLVGSPGSNQVLATISQTDPIYVSTRISEIRYLQIVERLRHSEKKWVSFQLLLADGRLYPHSGTMSMAGRTFDSETGTLKIRIRFPNPRAVLKPGEFARVRVRDLQAPKVVTVPQRAVSEELASKQVYVVNEHDVVESHPVVVDSEVGDRYVIASGLKGDERVVVEGLQKIQPGITVHPVTAAHPAERP